MNKAGSMLNGVDDTVRAYVDAITPAQRPLFDRVDRLIREVHPDVELETSYKMPTYRVGERGTIRIRPRDEVSDDDLRELLRATLAP